MQKTSQRRRNIIKAILLTGLILASGLIIARSQPTFTLADQIVINTQRLNDLERRMRQLEEGGSVVANQTASHQAINDVLLGQLEADIRELKAGFLGVMIFLVTALVSFAGFVLKGRLFGAPSRPHRRD